MKTENPKAVKQALLPVMITALIAVMFLFSCKKDSVETMPDKNNMANTTEILAGNLLTGNIMVKSDENEVAINYNNGNKYILITKIPGTQIPNVNDMQSVSIITSQYGIVLKDLNNGEVYFLVNNDTKSINEFRTVQPYFKAGFQSNKIFGTTIVNGSKG